MDLNKLRGKFQPGARKRFQQDRLKMARRRFLQGKNGLAKFFRKVLEGLNDLDAKTNELKILNADRDRIKNIRDNLEIYSESYLLSMTLDAELLFDAAQHSKFQYFYSEADEPEHLTNLMQLCVLAGYYLDTAEFRKRFERYQATSIPGAMGGLKSGKARLAKRAEEWEPSVKKLALKLRAENPSIGIIKMRDQICDCPDIPKRGERVTYKFLRKLEDDREIPPKTKTITRRKNTP